jgi:hypothetical protein
MFCNAIIVVLQMNTGLKEDKFKKNRNKTTSDLQARLQTALKSYRSIVSGCD